MSGGGVDGSGEGEANPYSAAPSALEYLAQVEYALLLTLQRLDTELEFDISIETLDNIVFHDRRSNVDGGAASSSRPSCQRPLRSMSPVQHPPAPATGRPEECTP